MKKKRLRLYLICLFLTASAFCGCLFQPIKDGDFVFPAVKEGPLGPKVRTSSELVAGLNEFCVYHGSPLRVSFDGSECNLYRLDYIRAGKKESPEVPYSFPEMEHTRFTRALKRICETYGLESDRRENVFHLKKKKSRILLEAECEKANK
jgi:hypothetical protein